MKSASTVLSRPTPKEGPSSSAAARPPLASSGRAPPPTTTTSNPMVQQQQQQEGGGGGTARPNFNASAPAATAAAFSSAPSLVALGGPKPPQSTRKAFAASATASGASAGGIGAGAHSKGATNSNNNNSTAAGAGPAYGFLTREERLSILGVDCPDALTWRVWAVGGEYERCLYIKNTHDKRQIISYRLPKQKATFFVDFPQPATISSGMSYALVVKFRPVALVEHSDEVEILVKGRGSFKIRLEAFTPYAHLTTPDRHTFGMCQVHVPTHHDFPIKNTGTVPIRFSWDAATPFSITPAKGMLAEGEQMTVRATFYPREATSCAAQAVCRLESGDPIAFMSLSGIGKYAYIRVKEDRLLDFGPVLTTTTAAKYLTLSNPSCVPTNFSLRRADSDITNAFVISPMSGLIGPGEDVRLHIKFKPANTGAHYASEFVCESVSSTTLASFRCVGEAVGPVVSLSASSVDFGDVSIEDVFPEPAFAALPSDGKGSVIHKAVSGGPDGAPRKNIDRFVTLKNHSELPIDFQFVGCFPGCTFVVSPASGSVRAKSTINVKVTFSPSSPINYLRRLFLLHSAGENALLLDVFGTAFTTKSRPAPFSLPAVQLFFSKIEYGLGMLTPDDTGKVLAAIQASYNEDGAGGLHQPPAAGLLTNASAELNETQRAAQDALLAAYEEIRGRRRRRAGLASVFPRADSSATPAPFTLDRNAVTVRHEAIGQVFTVTVRNATAAKATAYWALPGDDAGQYWSVAPASADVSGHGTATFHIRCAPNAPPQSFGAFLECFVNYKTMRSFRLVDEDVFTPPHCLLLQVQHLAPFKEHGPIPSIRCTNAITFPPCRHQRSVYQVMEIANDGDTAVAYDLQMEASMVPDHHNQDYFSGASGRDDDGSFDAASGGNGEANPEDDLFTDRRRRLLAGVFQCFPPSGVVPGQGKVMVLVKFTPPLTSRFFGGIHLAYNGASTSGGNILVKGEGFVPELKLEDRGVLAFRPTVIGGSTSKTYILENPSRIPVEFSALVPPDFADIVELVPSRGVLKGSERLEVRATYTPQAAGPTDFRFPIAIRVPDDVEVDDHDETVSRVWCSCRGEGHRGMLAVEPLSMSLGPVSVGAPTQRVVTLFNTCLCDVAYELRYIVRRGGQVVEESKPGDLQLQLQRSLAQQHSNSNDTITSDFVVPSSAQSAASMGVANSGSMPMICFVGRSGSGIIRARSHASVTVSVHLPLRGEYEATVFVLCGGNTTLLSRTALPTAPQALNRLAQCLIRAEGRHSQLTIVDARSVFQHKSQLWRQMSIGEINERLSEAVEESDLLLRAKGFDDTVALLEGLPCNLGVDIFHAAPTRILIAMKNISTGPLGFRFRFPLDNEIPKEPWHHDSRGLDDPIARIIDRGLFEVTPRSATVGPGETQLVQIEYFHGEVGTHTLPVVLTVQDGKQVLLNLSATTIEATSKRLLFNQGTRHAMQPVALGDLEPPLQYTEIQNVSAEALTYNVDDSSLNALKDQNYDFPVMQCLNPRGTIPPMSSLLLSWLFRPLEAKTYEVTVPILVEGGDRYAMTLTATGYHPKQTPAAEIRALFEAAFLMPTVPVIHHPSLPVRLTCDVLRFGPVPYHSLHRRHVALTNTHRHDTFNFEWRAELQHGDQIFEVDPPSGAIAPGETKHFRISMYSGSTAQILDTPIHCHLLNDSLRARRAAVMEERSRLEALEMDRVPDTDLGTTIDSGISGRSTLRSRKAPHMALKPRHRHPITTVPAKFQSTERLVKTIQKLEEAALAEPVDDDADEWAHVEVMPTLIELVVQSRIIPTTQYEAIYGEGSLNTFFFPTMLGNMLPTQPGYLLTGGAGKNGGRQSVLSNVSTLRPPSSLAEVSDSERDLAAGCIRELLKRVVQHAVVADAMNDPREDPVPYFCEMIATGTAGDGRPSNGSAIAELIIDEEEAARLADEEGGAGVSAVVTRFQRSEPPVPGDVQCVAEEILEDALFSIVAQALEREGVVLQAIDASTRQRRASEARRSQSPIQQFAPRGGH